MSITDELRKYANRFKNSHDAWSGIGDDLTAIADRIDAEHESMLGDWDYWESTHIELPKDADDVPWNVGDRDEDDNEVIALKLAPDGWYVIAVGEWPYRPESKCHYHKPTVEDVLREFAYGLGVPVADSYIAASAAKLRLAEGEDA